MNPLALIVISTLGAAAMGGQTAAAGDPLQSRVTIDYREAPAADVIRTLATAVGLKVEIGAGKMRPVTITLTNVRLGTALNALCDNALCSWRLEWRPEGSLNITPAETGQRALLPPRVSFSLNETPASDVFRAVAAAIDVPVTVDPTLPTNQVSLNFNNAATSDVLNMLCNILRCEWDFDPVAGLRVTRKP
jgi:hypothetical protein